MDLNRIKSVTILHDERVLIGGEPYPDEVRLPGGAILKPRYSGGRVVNATAIDEDGTELDTFFATISSFERGSIENQLPNEHTGCMVCVCYGDGGCKCIPIQCPQWPPG